MFLMKLTGILMLLMFVSSMSLRVQQFATRCRVSNTNLGVALKLDEVSHKLSGRNAIKSGIAAVCSFALSYISPAYSVTPLDWKCSDNVVVMTDNQGKDVTIVGTAHISVESVDRVKYAIRETKPDVVMIELDKKRLGKVDNSKGSLADFGFVEPVGKVAPGRFAPPLQVSATPLESPPSPQQITASFEKVNKLKQITEYVKETFSTTSQRVLGAALGKALSQFYNSVEKLGFSAGGEFKAAVEEARTLGVPVLLGDRDVDVTLRRLAGALGSVDSTRAMALVSRLTEAEKELGLAVPPDQGIESINKETLSKFVEDLKLRSSVTKITNIIKEEIPAVYDALIGERDEYMAEAVRTSPGHNIVGVVGLAHLPGIERNLEAAGLHAVPQEHYNISNVIGMPAEVSKLAFGVVLTSCTMVAGLLVLSLYGAVQPYMDELFHIPQAQAYCNNEFHVWNKGITTYPGLYLLATGVRKLIWVEVCSTTFLRSLNVALASLSLPLLFHSRKLICPSASDHTVTALVLFLYPLSLFYYFLYYTDTLSTVTLVLTYWLSLKVGGANSGPALYEQIALLMAASASVLARQTNAVWLLFFAGTSMLQCVVQRGDLQDNQLTLPQCLKFLLALWKRKGELLWRTWPLLLPVALFVGYVVKTGSIVVGDKENHKPVLHFAMLAHGFVVITAVQAPMVALEAFRAITAPGNKENNTSNLQLSWASVVGYVAMGALAASALIYGSHSHPFLLSDNRHYMFYIWKRFLSHEMVRLLVSPLYGMCTCLALWRLRHRRGPLWILIFLVAMAITLIPTPLLEPRYFTPAVIVAVLNGPEADVKSTSGRVSMGAVIVGMVVVNVVTIWVFLYRPFVWGDGTTARFMY